MFRRKIYLLEKVDHILYLPIIVEAREKKYLGDERINHFVVEINDDEIHSTQ